MPISHRTESKYRRSGNRILERNPQVAIGSSEYCKIFHSSSSGLESSCIASQLTKQLSISGRLVYRYSEKMSGTQSDLSFNPPFAPSRRTVTTAFSENYGGQRVDAAIGLNYFSMRGPLQATESPWKSCSQSFRTSMGSN